MDRSDSDLTLAFLNRSEGIKDYLKSLGKLYITPHGAFSSLTDIVNEIGGYPTSILRRIKSKQTKFNNWYTIDSDTNLLPMEVCEYCDEVDDILFSEGLWYSHIEDHKYGSKIQGDSIITYLYRGKPFEVTYLEFKQGVRPHKGKVICQ
jgi:hypothetical protein